MIMQTASLFSVIETDGDYGKEICKNSLRDIECFLSFGTGSTYTQNQLITEKTTHTALTLDKGVKAGMLLVVDGTEYKVNAANNSGRFTILYLQQEGGVSNAD